MVYTWGTDRYKSRKIIYSRPRKLVLIYFGFHQTVNEALVTPFRFINTGYGLKMTDLHQIFLNLSQL